MTATHGDLRESDLHGAIGVLQSLAEERAGSRSFVIAALDRLTSVVPSELTTLSLCDLEHGSRSVIGRAGEALSDGDRAAFDRHFREHPLVRFHGSNPGGPTQRISDCVDGADFRNSALHADYYRRLGINYVMALPLWIDSANVISVVFNRGRSDFRNTERAVLDAVRQPLASIYRNIIACEEAGVGLKRMRDLATDGGWQTTRVSTSGRILEAPPQALSLLKRFFPDGAPEHETRLPAMLFEWFSASRNWGLERPAITCGQEFTVSRLGAKLTVHFVADPEDASAGFLLMKSERTQLSARQLAQLSLTERERGVLALVAGGKTNGEIAQLLTISARTVQKHLEHIFQKLGVETRTAAAVCALAAADRYAAAAA
jgi:DNA-binding CsgD family transcriptional regulator